MKREVIILPKDTEVNNGNIDKLVAKYAKHAPIGAYWGVRYFSKTVHLILVW